jgi:phosphohistidine phosphatase
LGSIDHREEPRIYAANTTRLMDIINGLPEGSGHVMLVGHNPAVTELVEELSDAHLGHLVPCTIVRIDLEAERWSEVARGTGTMVWWDSPKRG